MGESQLETIQGSSAKRAENLSYAYLSRWAVAIVGLAAAFALAPLLRSNQRLMRAALVLAGFLPFISLWRITVNLYYEPFYRGESRGFEVTGLDLLLVAIYFASPRPSRPNPYRWILGAYFSLALLLFPFAITPIYSAFGVWKVARMWFACSAIWRACESGKLAPDVLRGMCSGVVYEALVVAWQHWVEHKFQAPGTLLHPNSMTMCCNLITPIALALVLGERSSALAKSTLLAGVLACPFGLSRASLMMFGASVALVYFLSNRMEPTPRKRTLGMVGLVLLIAVAIKAAPTVMYRFTHASPASESTREQFKEAARLMIAEHPFGVGINEFADHMERGYSLRAGIPAHSVDTGATVHNIYYLTCAELGFLGLAIFLWLLWTVLRLAWQGAKVAQGPVRDALIGAGVAVFISCVQGMLEWLSRQTPFSFLFYMLISVIAALHAHAQRHDEASQI